VANLFTSSLALGYWLWDIVCELLLETNEDPFTCGPLFDLAPVLLKKNESFLVDQFRLREFFDSLAGVLLKVKHAETFNSSVHDPRIRGLSILMRECIIELKKSDQPLQLEYVTSLFRSTNRC